MNTTAIRIETPVTFRKHTKHAITYGVGSIFENWHPASDGDQIIISRGPKHIATISMDDATPLEWDDLDKAWTEA